MPATRSSAATNCISDVPGLAKHVSTPEASRLRTSDSAPVMSAADELIVPLWRSGVRPRNIAGGTAPQGEVMISLPSTTGLRSFSVQS